MKRGLIVSCQALENEPLHSSFIMGKMALAAEMGGAVGIRANGVEDILEIKKMVNLPIIGIIKKDYENMVSYITPTRKELEALIDINIDVIALDATINADLNLLNSLKIKYPNQKFMADISTVEEGIRAEKLGFDYIGTTLVGYTEQSKNLNNFDVLKELLEKCNTPIIAEGNFDTPEKSRKAMEMGSYAVVVGGAITRPQLITKKFSDEINKVNF
ncbi:MULTISPECIES: N-acetylmannosamine-6-phosphate 2-epimerase [Cetobacterium]|jgi:N-acylglucosamine-6-phosphate 2-epimerase|uniref:Putative N-acetylmannosamine-6-phosphate 2-epimerase n=1 Tax=Candidatus Cetobacterium colombiensis TaxID=3073100 RepID=A0ABU4W728_9FUSO|nr:N-acetylmannosamine-6-phosphate 2-epimerase [Candidatus Cetobacterium colombiensis]MDX8335328.1 N-acetylmannosamine-6-phosphate 2-epimerase [Candidatus Cetobacterium colombiensis]